MPEDAISEVAAGLYLTTQLDDLHLSLDQLAEMNHDGDFDLFLDQPKKTSSQKAKFLEKVIESLPSPLLRKVLTEKAASGTFDFFLSRLFSDFVGELQATANQYKIVGLTVAVDFTTADVRAMAESLAAQLGHPVVLNLKVDHSLIGGAIVQYGSHVWDSSIKSKIAAFRTTWKEAVVGPPTPVA